MIVRRVAAGALAMTAAATAAVPDSASTDSAFGAPGATVAVGATIEQLALDAASDQTVAPSIAGAQCPAERLHVRWALPAGSTTGAHIEPLGPAPTDTTSAVNGVVICEGTAAYMGFEAVRSGTTWSVHATPDVDTDDGPMHDPDEHVLEPDELDPPTPVPTAPPTKVRPPVKPGLGGKKGDGSIEPYAAYDPQTTCSAGAKPGVLDFRDRLLATYPASRSLGISRACSVGGRSEHKEGRALDWGVRVDRPAERASAEAVLTWLLATDAEGNEHANARRLGVMYIVWNKRIWGAYRADAGWRPYRGSSPHTDHIHFSFAWPGARAKTSFWTGKAAEMPGAGAWRSAGSDVRAMGHSHGARTGHRHGGHARSVAARKAEREARIQARRDEREARIRAWRDEREARLQARREAREADNAERAADAAERQARRQEWLEAREARRKARAEALEARRAAWIAEREARKARAQEEAGTSEGDGADDAAALAERREARRKANAEAREARRKARAEALQARKQEWHERQERRRQQWREGQQARQHQWRERREGRRQHWREGQRSRRTGVTGTRPGWRRRAPHATPSPVSPQT
jgi:hypothetical protein